MKTKRFIYKDIFGYLGDYLFIYTKHAIEKMNSLGIEKKEVERAVIEGMKWKEESSDKWHAQMAGVEAVFVKQDKDFFVITAYLAGRSK